MRGIAHITTFCGQNNVTYCTQHCSCGCNCSDSPTTPPSTGDTVYGGTILVPIIANDQTSFIDVIPEDRVLREVFVEGLLQFPQDPDTLVGDYIVDERSIEWVNTVYPLKTIYRMYLVLDKPLTA